MNNNRVDFKFPHVNGASNKTLPKLKELKIGSLNVCGLGRRMHYPEFREIINGFDIFGVAETKLDDLDVMSLTNYTYIGKTRKQKYKRKKWGAWGICQILFSAVCQCTGFTVLLCPMVKIV